MAISPALALRSAAEPEEGASISLDAYLRTAWSPDVDSVEGSIEERNLGERDHALILLALGYLFQPFRKSHDLWALPEQRVRVGPSRYRMPDVCVTKGKPRS